MKNKAFITEIQRASFVDGPGMRTVVFFKGCPLSCAWCHNPECISTKPQMMYYPEKCIGCNMCDKGCFSGAKVLCGKEMTATEIFSEILLDKSNYGSDGGVTFSGGEVMLYPDILSELIQMCRKNGISTAIETSLYLYDKTVLSGMDYIMADFKIWDSQKHKSYTGADNGIIKENIKKLDKLGIPFIIRTPVISGINDNAQEISAIRDYIKQFKNLKGYELLPYHPLGESKRRALGMEAVSFETPSKAKMEELMIYAKL